MKQKIGVILTNLGSPAEPSAKAIGKYLKEFLSDPRVVDLPRWQWLLILNLFIVPFRSKANVEPYSSIWTQEGSPLLVNTIKQQQLLKNLFAQKKDIDLHIEIAMTYGNPSMQQAVDNLTNQKVDKIIVLPLFPQYSCSSTAAALDAFTNALKKHKRVVPFDFIHNYHDHPLYIKALSQSITDANVQDDELLLFSYHSIPIRYETEGDFYRTHCTTTTNLVAKDLNLSKNQFKQTFQSRFGPEDWLQPYTNETLEFLPTKGIKKIVIICPGFASDCLETLEEICKENKEVFLNAGGESYRYIPCLNDNPFHIKLLSELILSKI